MSKSLLLKGFSDLSKIVNRTRGVISVCEGSYGDGWIEIFVMGWLGAILRCRGPL